MRKLNKILAVFLVSIIISISTFQLSFAQNISEDTYVLMYLNQTQINVIKGDLSNLVTLEAAPFAPNGTTLVPIRAVLEAFGANLVWDGSKQQVNIIKGDIRIIITINRVEALVGGKKVKLAEPAIILNGRTLIPLRFVSENLGLNVKWYQESKKIIISNITKNKGVFVAKSEYYNDSEINKSVRNVCENYEEFTKYEINNNSVTINGTTKRLNKINNSVSFTDSVYATTIEKDGQNSIINEVIKSENGEVLNKVEGYSNARYDKDSKNINIVSNEIIKSNSGETIKTRRIKSYIKLSNKMTFEINSSIYEYLPGGECISYFEEGSDFINGNMSSKAQSMNSSGFTNYKYVSCDYNSSTDFLIYNGIVLSDKGILTNGTIDVTQTKLSSKAEIMNVIKEGLQNIQETIDISKYVDSSTTINDVLDKYDEVLDDNPEIFYCYSNIYYSYGGILKPVYLFPREEIPTLREAFNAKVDKVISEIIKPGMTDFQKELVIHNYITKYTSYDEDNFLKDTVPAEDHTAYGVLMKGTGVCDGYAKVTKLLADKVGLDCSIVSGKVRNKDGVVWNLHAWNLIKLNGKYYQLDVTWDDPIPDNPDVEFYNYFNITDKEISANHKWESSKYPVSDDMDYNYFYMNNAVIDNYQSFFDSILNAVKSNKKEVLLKITNYNEKIYDVSKAMDSIWNNNSYSVTSCKYSADKEMGTIRIEFGYK